MYANANPLKYIDPTGEIAFAPALPVLPAIGQAIADAAAIAFGLWALLHDTDKSQEGCRFIREVYYGGPCKQCWYKCPGYGAQVVFQQAVGKPCPSVGANGLVNTDEIDPACKDNPNCE